MGLEALGQGFIVDGIPHLQASLMVKHMVKHLRW